MYKSTGEKRIKRAVATTVLLALGASGCTATNKVDGANNPAIKTGSHYGRYPCEPTSPKGQANDALQKTAKTVAEHILNDAGNSSYMPHHKSAGVIINRSLSAEQFRALPSTAPRFSVEYDPNIQFILFFEKDNVAIPNSSSLEISYDVSRHNPVAAKIRNGKDITVSDFQLLLDKSDTTVDTVQSFADSQYPATEFIGLNKDCNNGQHLDLVRSRLEIVDARIHDPSTSK